MQGIGMDPKQFLDMRTHGFFRVAAVRPNITIGNPGKNVDEHLRVLDEAYRAGVMLAVCPELGLTGYTLEDMLHQEIVGLSMKRALERFLTASKSINMMIAVGLPLHVQGGLYNVALVVHRGKILAAYPKSYLPNYREFRDHRWFIPTKMLTTDTVEILGQTVPIGSKILIEAAAHPGAVIHFEVCEDGWVPVSPHSVAALAGATIVCNLSASNATVGKSDYRLSIFGGSSGKDVVTLIYSSCGFGESTRDAVWDGEGFIFENGTLLAHAVRYQMQSSFIAADTRPMTMLMERQRQNTYAANAADFVKPGDFRRVVVKEQLGTDDATPYIGKLLRKIEKNPFLPSDPVEFDRRCQDMFNMQAMALATRMKATGIYKLVIGVSGGLDSTLALLIAARAMDLLGMPRSNIIAVTMPGLGTSKETKSDALAIAKAIGCTVKTISIVAAVKRHLRDIGHDGVTPDATFENAQARERTQILFDLANRLGAMVLGTGDLSELGLGWCTYNGDHMANYNPNGGIPKTLVKFLVKWAAEKVFAEERLLKRRLLSVANRAISPELTPLKDGQIAQKTEDLVGPYELHDFYFYWYIRFGYRPLTVAYLAHLAWNEAYSIGENKKWLTMNLRRFFANQFKRDTVPPSPKVGTVTFSPRTDHRQSPETDPAIWLEDVELVPEQLAA